MMGYRRQVYLEVSNNTHGHHHTPGSNGKIVVSQWLREKERHRRASPQYHRPQRLGHQARQRHPPLPNLLRHESPNFVLEKHP
jgi:hypothetical protein